MAKKNETQAQASEIMPGNVPDIERFVQKFEALCADVVTRKNAIAEKLHAGEHARQFAKRVEDATPESGVYDLEAVEAAARSNVASDDWPRLRHGYYAALSRPPGEDSELCADACSLLEEITTAAATLEAKYTYDIRTARREAQEANARLAAAQEARKHFRMNANGRLLAAFRDAVRSGSEISKDRYWMEGLNEPHTRMISGLASVHAPISDMCEMLTAELESVNREAAERRNIPERVEFIKTEETRAGMASPDELKLIGENNGKGGGLRDMFRSWAGK